MSAGVAVMKTLSKTKSSGQGAKTHVVENIKSKKNLPHEALGTLKRKASTLDSRKSDLHRNDIGRNIYSPYEGTKKNESRKREQIRIEGSEKDYIGNIVQKRFELEAKAADKGKVLKGFLENKYKVEFPKFKTNIVTKSGEDRSNQISAGKHQQITKSDFVFWGQEAMITEEEQTNLIKLYGKLEDGIQQAEEYFKSIGIEWSSTQQMFKIKPKKFLPAMTVIAFGPNYDDLIMCKDNAETGEMQACKLSTNNEDWPKDVTAINLHVYNDGYQPEEESFYAYTSESVKDFFMNNIGSYVIMKPNDTVPQTVLIRIVDKRDRNYDDVRKDRAQRQPKKPNKKLDNQSKSTKLQNLYPIMKGDASYETELIQPKRYYQNNAELNFSQKILTESIEIFEGHKIIKRLEVIDVAQDDPMGISSWYWKNQRPPMSSEYVVPPTIKNISAVSGVPDVQTVSSFEQDRANNKIANQNSNRQISKGGKSGAAVKIVDSLINEKQIKKTPGGQHIEHQKPIESKMRPLKEKQMPQSRSNETKISKMNIYHRPVTLINLGEGSKDRVHIKTSPSLDNRYKVNMERKQELKSGKSGNIEKDSFSQGCDEFICNLEQDKIEIDKLRTQDTIFETEYQDKCSKSDSKWSERMDKTYEYKSISGINDSGPGEYVKCEHMSIFEQNPLPVEEGETAIKSKNWKHSILLDLGGKSGTNNLADSSLEGIMLNKKTSNTQITVSLKDNVNGKKYLVNIYPEEHLKKIWSVLKLNHIEVEDVIPELVLGNPELTKGIDFKLTSGVTGNKKEQTIEGAENVLKTGKEKDDSTPASFIAFTKVKSDRKELDLSEESVLITNSRSVITV